MYGFLFLHSQGKTNQFMTDTSKLYCVILAGGKGRRLWPVSRENNPKQFLDFFGTGRTQLQQTFDYFNNVLPKGHVLVSTNVAFADIVKEQLPELPQENLLVEPIHRNTAPSVAWAALRIKHLQADAKMIVSPSDQAIIGEAAFAKNIGEALNFIDTHDCLLAMGVQPTRPEPGYGYIQKGDEAGVDIYTVKSFTEKPEREFAQMFMDNGEFYWNTGMYVASVDSLLNALSKLWPTTVLQDSEIEENTIEKENAFMADNFARFPNMSLDNAILERSENVFMLKCDFGWADLGTWHSIYEAKRRSKDDNVVIDSDVIIEDCSNNIIKLPKDHLAVINGLDGYIVAEKDNVLLICKKEDSSALIRKYVNEVQMKKGDDFV